MPTKRVQQPCKRCGAFGGGGYLAKVYPGTYAYKPPCPECHRHHPNFKKPLGKLVSLYEVDAIQHFAEDNINWQYCESHVEFHHKHACEFLICLHQEDYKAYKEILDEMNRFGCTSDFIETVEEAHDKRAEYILFFV